MHCLCNFIILADVYREFFEERARDGSPSDDAALGRWIRHSGLNLPDNQSRGYGRGRVRHTTSYEKKKLKKKITSFFFCVSFFLFAFLSVYLCHVTIQSNNLFLYVKISVKLSLDLLLLLSYYRG